MRSCPARTLKRVLILEQRARGPGMGGYAMRRAGRRQGSTDMVTASLLVRAAWLASRAFLLMSVFEGTSQHALGPDVIL
jgi:hypothetical protein